MLTIMKSRIIPSMCTDLRAVCIVVSIWKMIGNGCLSVVETGELHHSIPDLHTGNSLLFSCNIFGVLACCFLLYGTIQSDPIAIMICLIVEMVEILLVFAYCVLVMQFMCSTDKIELGMIENVALFLILGMVWILFWIYGYKLYRNVTTKGNDDRNVLMSVRF